MDISKKNFLPIHSYIPKMAKLVLHFNVKFTLYLMIIGHFLSLSCIVAYVNMTTIHTEVDTLTLFWIPVHRLLFKYLHFVEES